MSTDDDSRTIPSSMRHKRVLEIAEDRPEASFEEIASEVPSATVDLVEQVLDKYGDPASTPDDPTVTDEQRDTEVEQSNEQAEDRSNTDTTTSSIATDETDSGGEPSTDTSLTDKTPSHEDDSTTDGSTHNGRAAELTNKSGAYPSPESLTEKQRAVLELIAIQPDATQQELGEQLGVTSATVSNRVNSIEGFEWSERQQFVNAVLETEPTADMATDDTESESSDNVVTATDKGSSRTMTATDEQLPAALERIEDRLDAVANRIATIEDNQAMTQSPSKPFEDPELVYKVVHACMDADTISEDEELRILRGLLRGPPYDSSSS